MRETGDTGHTPLPADNKIALCRVSRAARKGALATTMAGHPYVSLVTVAFDHDLSPILLLSALADHTRNLLVDPRAALLLDGSDGHPNPQTGPRVTLIGTASRDDDPRLRARFLAHHPAAAAYAGFADFGVWRLGLERAHFVGGFARAVWFDAPLAPAGTVAAMAAAEPTLLERINSEHMAALGRAAMLHGGHRMDGWSAVSIDMDGCDLRSGDQWTRLDFDRRAATPDEALAMIRALP